MRDPEPCRIKHTEEQTDLMEKTHSQIESISFLKRREKKSFTCTQCGNTLICGKSIKRHMMIHTGEKPFTCDQCGKRFRQSAHLNRHMIIHTGEILHKCDQCGKSFACRQSLKVHMKSHTGEKTFTCDQCGKSFKKIITP
ncbi:gastrula zinc finger protein XlCGF57.1-like [Cyprinus carpio]|uniref:Gastrula zinc finger protein XlCGF57.1-like n=1 Tax=Cyprinus carpio TaxID=7962 RepID=A0A9Q9Y8G4_CYPCA|nr:gastrula zinc finger protein XlCGF57.1-like [Cyprinus carpio]